MHFIKNNGLEAFDSTLDYSEDFGAFGTISVHIREHLGCIWAASGKQKLIPLFVVRFLISFWEPLGSHFRTFGQHVATKGRLKTHIVFRVLLCRFVNNFRWVRP